MTKEYPAIKNMNKLSPRRSGGGLRCRPVILSEAKDLLLSRTSLVHVHYRGSTNRPPLRQHRLHIGDIHRAMWLVELAIAVPTIIMIGRTYSLIRTIRYVIGLTAALVAQHTFLSSVRHKIGSEKSSLADLLTLSRATTGAVLAGLVTSGIRDRKGVAGWIAWSMTLLGVTASDWLDGLLARHTGSTRLGAVLDIEADSWLTFWSAAGAVAWGELPGWCLHPPIVRYLDPLIDILDGKLPKGGGPWWSRVTGTAQMVLIIAALAPIRGRLRDQALAIAALPISTAQLVTILVLLMKKLSARRENIHGHL